MNAPLEPKCANSEKCPQRMTCVRHIAPAYDEHQVYASYFIAGAERCSGYWPSQEGTA